MNVGQWAQSDLDRLAHLMCHVVEYPEKAWVKGAVARRDAVRKWRWNNAARIAIEHVRNLLVASERSAGILS